MSVGNPRGYKGFLVDRQRFVEADEVQHNRKTKGQSPFSKTGRISRPG
jgi:hypothetical protein